MSAQERGPFPRRPTNTLRCHRAHNANENRFRGAAHFRQALLREQKGMVPTHDIREALDAWIERRAPQYQGR